MTLSLRCDKLKTARLKCVENIKQICKIKHNANVSQIEDCFIWPQNGFKMVQKRTKIRLQKNQNRPKIDTNIDPKWTQKQIKNRTKIDQKQTPKLTKNLPKIDPKWTQSGPKKGQKWAILNPFQVQFRFILSIVLFWLHFVPILSLFLSPFEVHFRLSEIFCSFH